MPHAFKWRTLAIATAMVAAAVHAAAEEKSFPVVVYFSKDDPHWRGVEKLIDAVAAKHPSLNVTRIDIDTPNGYKLLHFYEEQYHVPEPGELTVTVASIGLIDKGERRDIERYFLPVVERLLGLHEIKGKQPVDAARLAAFAQEIFGKDADAVALGQGGVDKNLDFFRVRAGGKDVGWVVSAFQKIECPICIDAQFLIAVKSPKLTVLGMRPVRELERRGEKLDGDSAAKFLAQFKGRAVDDVRTGVDAISGATKTSHAYQTAVFEALSQLKLLEKK